MAGAVLGAVQLSLFMARAILDEVAFKLHIDNSWQAQDLAQFNCSTVTFRGRRNV